ncbi:hypothetical protein KX816_12755 [Sphingosinicellaceae bacterium]|nr:hypothetical protein KX816_12755 [Sphingosinicellaceae bacterium]
MTDRVENQVATELLEGATPEERLALSKWASTLLSIRDSSDDGFGKARAAFMATVDSTTAWPLIRRIGDAIKRNAWDERSTTERAGVGAATAMVALFGGTFAVLTALGTAVGTPLWIVFGSGDGFAKQLVAGSGDAPIV